MKTRSLISQSFLLGVVLIAPLSSVHAVVLQGTFNPTPLDSQGTGVQEDPNDVVDVTVSDRDGGGVDVLIANMGNSDNIGAVYFQGFSSDQFTAPDGGELFDPGPTNVFVKLIGGPGVGFFATGVVPLTPGESLLYSTPAGSSLTASDFLSIEIGTITVREVDSLNLGLFRGTLEEATTDLDADNDGVVDTQDNCTFVANPDQRDTNGDGFGNACDADLNNDNIINVTDLGLLRSVFFNQGDALDADFNGDGVVNITDLGIMRQSFFAAPGPSGTTPNR